MSKVRKTLDRILRGTSDANITFADLCAVLMYLGFAERIRGSHHVFTRDNIPEILNVQPRGAMAKPYQVKQVRTVIVNHRLADESVPPSVSDEEPAADDQSQSESGESGA